jgi:hypothetical protein
VNAQAVAAAQQRLLAAYDDHASRVEEHSVHPAEAVAMELWPEVEREPVAKALRSARKDDVAEAGQIAAEVKSSDAALYPAGSLTVRLYEDSARTSLAAAPERLGRASIAQRSMLIEGGAAEAMALDDEIAFRQAPIFEEPAGPAVALPANLIEFPRQLVAARKARPRYAEGPLRDEAAAAVGDGQLRIFEVDPAQISTMVEEAVTETRQWSSIWLDAPAEVARAGENSAGDEAGDESFARAAIVIEPASLTRRGAAAAINFAIVGAVMCAFAAVVVATAGRGVAWHTGLPGLANVRQLGAELAARTDVQAKSAGIAVLVSGAVLLLMYHALFLMFSAATPGMRCVRIAFCTFEDESPTRRAVRRRMWASLLSACALGMGYGWAALDEQRLTWHDRMSRMYLRQY